MSLPISLVIGLQLAVTTPARPSAEVLPVAQTQSGVYHARSGAVDVAMPAPQKADVVIDGRLDEPVWRSAQLLTGFSRFSTNRPAPVARFD